MSAAGGEALLAARIARIPAALDAVAASPAPNLGDLAARSRRIVVTGLGSSASCARVLVHALGEPDGPCARFAPASALLAPPPSARDDVLVVFSQGLSPNARLVLATPEAWKRVVLVTATGGGGGARADAPDKRTVLARLARAGAIVVPMPGEDEYGTLVRVLGPVAGLARAFDLARALRGSGDTSPSDAGFDAAGVSAAMARAAHAAQSELGARGLPAPDESLAFVASGSYTPLAENLPRKILEGWLAPEPRLLDALEAGHGPLQQLRGVRACFVWLARTDAPGEDALCDAFARSLAPEQRMLRFPARLPGELALFEHEAAANVLLLAGLRARAIDPGEACAGEAEPPLYTLSRPPEPPPLLAELTWPELEARVAAGRRTLVVGLGATEQHGPHLPFATDLWIAEELVRRLCARLDDAIGAPVLPVGCSDEHMAFAGTLSVESDTLRRWLRDLLASAARHGFEAAFVFSAHGGNVAPLRAIAPELARDVAPLRLTAFTDLARVATAHRATSRRLGVDPADAGQHAGELETSILLALRPASVRRERLAAGLRAAEGDARELVSPRLREHAPSGVVGDPRGAAAVRAEPYLEAWAEELAAAYRCAKNESQTKGTSTP